MVEIIQENKPKDFLSKLGMGLGRAGETFGAHFDKAISGQQSKQEEEKLNKRKTLQGLDASIDQMLDLMDKPGVGLLGQFNPSGDARYNRGQLQTLKGELLNYYKTLFPRGLTQQEFKKLEEDYLPGTYDTVQTSKGKLDAFKDLIYRKLEQEEPRKEMKKNGKKEKPSLESFWE